MSTDLTPILVITLFLLIVAIAIVLLVVIYQKKQIQGIREKEQLKVLFEKEILESKLEIQEQTFKNISQEIHDNIGQELILAKLTISTMNYSDTLEVQEKLESTGQLLGKAIQDLRHLSKSLNADYISELGLAKAIENEIDTLKKTGRFHASFQKPGTAHLLSHQHEVLLFRIFQELLNNIIKHSNATNIVVAIEGSEDEFIFRMSDNGDGFNVFEMDERSIEASGSGLKNMKNRSKMMGAGFQLDSEEGKGTNVRITLPLKP